MEIEKRNRDVILIVDDIDVNRMILTDMLESDYEVIEASGGVEALNIMFGDDNKPAVLPTIVLLDIMMPDMDGYQVLEKMKANADTRNIPILFITAADKDEDESRGLAAGAADYITKPFNLDVVRMRVDNNISLVRYRHKLEQLVEIKTREVTKTYESTLEVLATIIEYRNLESGAHIRRTTLLTGVFVEKLLEYEDFKDLLSHENITSLVKASALHDIGKIGIPDSILLAPRKLTRDEFEVIKTHTTVGSRIIDSISENLPDNDQYLKYANNICHHHHERWDGKGYPSGLAGEDIPLSARIVSIVDVYDALTSTRCYKGAYGHGESLDIINEGKGTQFDPKLVDILNELAVVFSDIVERHRD